jgi:type I restriction-modification system DNA methylase subunit
VDDEVFGDICEDLSDVNSPYDFNAIPIHILGSIYERFLGKVIVATDKRAKVEEKPEVRKAGGVYYTPEYIVRYIVANTVGKLVQGKTPADISRMRFADIACGSGSFLLGVYDYLLRYHGDWYNSNAKRIKRGDCFQHEDGTHHLTLAKRREILLNNIFGVDVDPQAVEVAQLSLYLKLLEEDTTSSARWYQTELHAALLPALGNNIVCGNSLIGTDILDGKLFGEDEERKLNPMNFEDAFPEIMSRGGFDAIVGNPPYIRIQGFPRDQIQYLVRHYPSATGNCDIYVSFAERGLALLKDGGRMGYILPNKFFRTDYGRGLRTLISSEQAVTAIVDFKAEQVFDATTYTCLLFLSGSKSRSFSYSTSLASAEALTRLEPRLLSADSLSGDPWNFHDDRSAGLAKKIRARSKRLLDLPADMSRGSSTGADEAFVVEGAPGTLESKILRRPLFASDFGRYRFEPRGDYSIIFPYVREDAVFRL